MTEASPFHNAAFTMATPRLSVLIPFYNESPMALLQALQTRDPHEIEVILIDDGSCRPDITADVRAFIDTSPLACELITLVQNQGRSRGRNTLSEAARGAHFLFLDSDMLPDGPAFLDTWLYIARRDAAVVFGGFSLDQAPVDAAFDVHRALAGHSDCLNAAERSLMPEKYVFTSNLLIRRDVFAAEGLDPEFTGWGWEDVEWAMRVAARFPVEHIDNTATHMGLDRPETLARKYEQSVGNFARVIRKHPQVVSQYASYKAAKLLKIIPLLSVARSILKAVALNDALPARLRASALRVYRAALYAQVV
jgi:glycosyltransferase involved in cell wall biosynthesis